MSGSIDGIIRYLSHGKVIIYHGWDDMLVQPYVSTRLYEVIKDRGGTLANNSRLYMFPGMGHCVGGVGADSADLISGIVNWVENGVAPDDSLVASKFDSARNVLFTRRFARTPNRTSITMGIRKTPKVISARRTRSAAHFLIAKAGRTPLSLIY